MRRTSARELHPFSEIQHKNKLNGAVLGSYTYAYDALGNISTVTRSGFGTTTYAYDTLNQLTSATTVSDSATRQFTYTYDTFGNLRASSDGTVTHTYTYGDSDWKDLLTAYDGHTITYDAIGNPLTYHDGTSFTWRNGRQLASLTKNNQATTYQYDPDGLRTKKLLPNGNYTEYYWQDGRLIAERVYTSGAGTSDDTNEIHIFSYDESGAPIGIRIGSTDYYYGRNAQGDIEALYEWKVTPGGDEYAGLVATYEYDPWGKLLAVKDADGNAITSSGHAAIKNPLRYRGYYYDIDSGFYYLQSRYYDPQIGRFISVDNQISNSDLASMNLFAYCGNNPVNRNDPTGEAWWHWAIGAAIVAVCAVATVATCGGFAAAAGAVAGVACGVAASSTAATVAAGALLGSATALGVAAVTAASSSRSVKEFCDNGNWNTVLSVVGGTVLGMASAAALRRKSCQTAQTSTSRGRSYDSFKEFKNDVGSAGAGNQWHHIVEQCQERKSGFDVGMIQNTNNIVSISADVHRLISGYYSSIQAFTGGLTVRSWLAGQSFEQQYQFGLDVIKMFS